MKFLFKKIIPMLSVLILTFSLIGCAPKPNKTVENFLDCLKQQKISEASAYIKGSSNEALKFDDKEQEKIIKSVFGKIEYTLGDVQKDGNVATVKASITSVDLPKITTKMISDLLPTMMAQALSEENVDEKKQTAMMYQHMLNAVNDPKAPKTKTDVTIKLVKGDDKWFIQGNDDLLNALTGNFGSAIGELAK